MKRLMSVLLACMLLVSLAACGGSAEKAVTTDGSTSMDKVIGALGESFENDNEGVRFAYSATGSSAGIQAVKEGRCDIGLSSRALKDAEKAEGLVETVLAYDGIAVIVHPENPVSGLTLAQIAAVYTGEITNWSTLGGSDSEIVLIGREAGSGTRDGFETVTKTADACVLAQELTSTGAVIQAVASSENAIGYASLSSVEGNSGVKAVKVNGVICSEETVISGEYAIQRPFNMVVAQNGELSEAAGAFLTFALSPEAAQLIRLAGAVPVAADDNASGK